MKKVDCSKCGMNMYKFNIPHHMNRFHKDGMNNESNPPSIISSSLSTRDPSPVERARKTDVNVSELSTEKLTYLIQGAVSCMLRREMKNDLGTLRSYITIKFPEIPAVLRDSTIVTTFKTAQKVAATHFDAQLQKTEARSEWAHRSLAWWLHGLSYPEPVSIYPVEEPRETPADTGEYSPMNNFVADKILPVPFDSEAQWKEAERDFHNATLAIMDAAENI